MAYGFIATTNKVPDWTTLNAHVFKADIAIEMFPDLYNGFFVAPDNIDQVKKTLLSD